MNEKSKNGSALLDSDVVDDLSEDDFVPTKKGGKKKMSVERIYQKKTQLEHILLRPDTYIGSIEPQTQSMWVYDGEDSGMVLRDVSFVPGLYKIFDEIVVNAADNKQRDTNMDTLKIDIDPENNRVVVYNNGRGIPVVEHRDEKVYVPTLIFGHLLTGANFNDDEKKVVGGRNGFGAKLCNIFSTKFTLETQSKEYGKSFKQTWTDNMTKAGEVKIAKASGEDFTKVTFYPDLSKFSMAELDKDIVALMSRRAYDIAGTSRGVKVYLNGKRLPIKSFKDYVEQYLKGKEDETGNPLKSAYEQVSDRWEISVAVSDRGFQQVSFVNSIATTKGGRHVDHVTDQVVSKLADVVKKKNKGGVQVKPFQLKNHLWVFVNCLIENPAFDSQTKDTLNTQIKNFGSKCSPTEKFFAAALKTGVVESVMTWVKFKSEALLATKCHTKKHSKLRGIPKLEDANDAGTKNSIDCTLILTEGDSAKSLVVAGLGVIGRDKYGVFPLRGKMLNVREATTKQISENAEITSLLKIMGLQYKKNYESVDDLKTLRYGRLMIMTDQDQDGSHIKGLLINFIHHNWPSLLKLPFLEEFITPIVKASKGNISHSFYSLPEFEEWKQQTQNWNTWKVKYYKGLGTSTAAEAKEYFSDLQRHRIKFKYEGIEDDNAVNLAFSKKMVEQRKDWLTNSMEIRKQRRELGLSEIYLYGKDTKVVTYKDFVNKELVLFSNLDNERSIPSMMDGLKPGQRKVLYTCFKRNDKREVKVAQLAGSVGEHSAYHHGEASLMGTIIGLAQNFVGSNNINLLQPLGQFGTRLQGGKDAASPRYIFTMLSPLARRLFPQLDDALLNHLYDDNLKIEPEYYVPIIPMVLVNGAEGIGTGWSTKIPNYSPRELAENLRRMIRGDEPRTMKPWFKGFRGEIDQVEAQRYVVNGEVAELEPNKIEITELPVRIWTQNYKETVIEPLLNGSEKIPSFISDYKEYHTDATIRFVITLPEANLRKAEAQGIHKTFKVQTTFTTSSMVLFDHNGCLKKYDNVDEILKEFYHVRLEFYRKRKDYLEGMLEAEAGKLVNQARFISEKIDGKLKMENVKKREFVRMLIERGYDSDPVKAWRTKQGKIDEEETSESADGEKAEVDASGYDFDYLFDMTMRSMLREKVEELLKKRDAKNAELNKLRSTSKEELWITDLDAFLEDLDKVEAAEQEVIDSGKALKIGAKLTVKGGKGKNSRSALDTKPAADGQRVAPKIDFDMYKKKESDNLRKAAGKSKKGGEAKGDDSDDDRPLGERLGRSPEIISAKKSPVKKPKAAANGGAAKKKAKKMFDSSEEEEEDSFSEDEDETIFDISDDSPVKEKKKPVSKEAAPKDDLFNSSFDSSPIKTTQDVKKKFDFDSDSEAETKKQKKDDDSDLQIEIKKKPAPKKKMDDYFGVENRAKKTAKKKGSDDDFEMEEEKPKKKAAPRKKKDDANGKETKPKKKASPKRRKLTLRTKSGQRRRRKARVRSLLRKTRTMVSL
ncbi:DNA topoisomerase 2-beta [Halotydeus destructor]|nr:DNA topoisomerase 2-beta [Halotydeus destructor]